MKNNTTGLLFLIGAGAGAVATYLLDPDRGADRRAAIGDAASDAFDQTGDVVSRTVSQLSDTSREAGSRLAGYASDASKSARKTGSDWLERGQKQASRTGSSIGHWFEREEPKYLDRATSAAKSFGSHFDRDHLATPTVVGSSTATLLAGLGLYYFFGSSKGAERRRVLAEKVHYAARETGELGRRSYSYVRDRVGGQTGDQYSPFSETEVSNPGVAIGPSNGGSANTDEGNTSNVGEAIESGEPTVTGQGSQPYNSRF